MRRDERGRFCPAYLYEDFDPRGWPEPLPYIGLPLDNDCEHFAIVDKQDYPLLLAHNWHLHSDGRTKLYVRRGTDKAYLHREIMKQVPRPTEFHVIVDHENGNGLDCRRSNLRWATVEENNRNKHGYYFRQRRLAL